MAIFRNTISACWPNKHHEHFFEHDVAPKRQDYMEVGVKGMLTIKETGQTF